MQINSNLENLYKAGFFFLIILSVLALVYTWGQFKANKLIGSSAQNTIVVSGEGKVEAKPDISKLSMTLRETGKTAKEAQDKIATKWQAVKGDLAKYVDEKDIKTNTYSSYPKYYYPANSKPVLEGYEVTQNIDLKIRKVDDAGNVADAIAKAGINEVNGPSFSIDDESVLKDEARQKAIADAKSKAEKLANQLGVDLVRIVSFNESGDNNPVFYGRGEMMMSKAAVASAPMPEMPVGSNEVYSNVTITFEIK